MVTKQKPNYTPAEIYAMKGKLKAKKRATSFAARVEAMNAKAEYQYQMRLAKYIADYI